MTTMHLDDIRDTADRMYSMLGNSNVSDRFINSIYKYIDMVVMIECDHRTEKRRITQLGFLNRKNGVNSCTVIYEDGEFTGERIPDSIVEKLRKYNKNLVI